MLPLFSQADKGHISGRKFRFTCHLYRWKAHEKLIFKVIILEFYDIEEKTKKTEAAELEDQKDPT